MPKPKWFQGLAGRTAKLLTITLTLSLLVSFTFLTLMMRSWMLYQLDESLQNDFSRLVDSSQTTTELQPLGSPLDTAKPSGITPQNLESRLGTATRNTAQGLYKSEGTLVYVGSSTEASAILLQRLNTIQIPNTDLSQLAKLQFSTEPTTVKLGDSGSFRVLIREENGLRYVVGKGTSQIDSLLTATWVTGLATLFFTLGIAIFVTQHWVRRELHPLDGVVSVARQVSSQLQASGRATSVRVDTTQLQPGSEVGDVGFALNALLGSVDSSLAARDQSLQQLRRFVADASHELRTPLASIRGYSQLLSTELAAQGGLTSDAGLQRISAESARMSALVEDLLQLARLDAGRQLAREEVDLLQVAVESVADANAAGPDYVWKLDFIPEDVERTIICGDEPAIRQILANLLANARHHTPAGTEVLVGVRRIGEEVVLLVADNGPGIPPELLPKIFDRFVRGDDSRSRGANSGSSGLGLSIVQALVQAHGGRISVGPRAEGSGTAFRVSFPPARK